jgi:hypothetical protein
MIETKSNLRRSWYDYNWTGLWTYADHPQTTAILDDATTGQSTR